MARDLSTLLNQGRYLTGSIWLFYLFAILLMSIVTLPFNALAAIQAENTTSKNVFYTTARLMTLAPAHFRIIEHFSPPKNFLSDY